MLFVGAHFGPFQRHGPAVTAALVVVPGHRESSSTTDQLPNITALPACYALLHLQSLPNMMFDYLLGFGADVNNQSPRIRSEPNVIGSVVRDGGR